MTLSLTGRCARTGMLGVVIASSSPAVAARCAWARAGVGAVATQNVTDPRLAPRLLDLIERGESAADAVKTVVAEAPYVEYRQLAVVDARGGTGSFSGDQSLGRYTTATGADCVAAGNMLAADTVPAAMVDAFAASPEEHLVDRLLAALRAGAAAGGEEGPVHSCGVLVVHEVPWPVTDLRVDWAEDPVVDLERVWEVWRPQEATYVQRALDPRDAPSYGVPGDE